MRTLEEEEDEHSRRGRRAKQENFVSGKRNFLTTRRELLNGMKTTLYQPENKYL